MDMNGVGPVQGVFPVRATSPVAQVPKAAEVAATPRDALEISTAGRLLDAASRSPDVRAERLAQIKAEIAAGTYETPEKLEAALSRLLAEVGSDAGDPRSP